MTDGKDIAIIVLLAAIFGPMVIGTAGFLLIMLVGTIAATFQSIF